MNTTDKFVAYEYKNLTVKRESQALYVDCLRNFGWTLIEQQSHSILPDGVLSINPAQVITAVNVPTAPEKVDGPDMVTLKFKRDSRLDNKHEIDKLERKCEEALAAIGKLEKQSSAKTMTSRRKHGRVRLRRNIHDRRYTRLLHGGEH